MNRSIVVVAALLAAVVTAPSARASSPTGLTTVSLSLVTGASLSSHVLVTTGVTTPAAHTATRARHLRTRHHARHAHGRRAVVDAATRGRLARSEGSGPVRPFHHGVDHRAAVPNAQPRPHSSPSGSRGGPAAPASLTRLAPPVPGFRIVSDTRHSLALPEGRTISGRGPPAAGRPGMSLPGQRPSFRSRPVAGHAPETVPVTLESAASRSYRPSPATACPCPGRPHVPESVRDRSLDRRPEGATASFDPPSTGDGS